MDSRVAVVSIIVEDPGAAPRVNELLHQYADCAVGRMGLPYRRRNVSIICLVLDAPGDRINALTGALGRLPGVRAKAAFSGA